MLRLMDRVLILVSACYPQLFLRVAGARRTAHASLQSHLHALQVCAAGFGAETELDWWPIFFVDCLTFLLNRAVTNNVFRLKPLLHRFSEAVPMESDKSRRNPIASGLDDFGRQAQQLQRQVAFGVQQHVQGVGRQAQHLQRQVASGVQHHVQGVLRTVHNIFPQNKYVYLCVASRAQAQLSRR